MTSFERTHPGAWWKAREWRGARYLPIYVAGIAASAGLGVGLTFLLDGGPGSPAPTSPAPIVAQAEPPPVPTASISHPDLSKLLAGVDLPFNSISAPALVVPEAPAEPAPALEAAPAAPVAPVAPVAPAAAPAPINTAPPVEKPVEAPAPAPPPPAAVENPNFYLPAVNGGAATDLETRLMAGINAERAQGGLAAYTHDPELSKLARIRAQQMADQGYFGHVDPYGYSMYTELLQKFGFGYAWAGENLALNNYSVAESPERAVIALMKSPTHAANIMAGDFYRVGIGEVTTSDGRHIYAMIFLG